MFKIGGDYGTREFWDNIDENYIGYYQAFDSTNSRELAGYYPDYISNTNEDFIPHEIFLNENGLYDIELAEKSTGYCAGFSHKAVGWSLEEVKKWNEKAENNKTLKFFSKSGKLIPLSEFKYNPPKTDEELLGFLFNI